MAKIIEFIDISFTHPNFEEESNKLLFDSFSLHVEDGEVLVIVGMSGVGKSTLLRLASCLLKPNGGEIKMSIPINTHSRPFGFVFQDPRLFPWRRVRRNVLFGLEGLHLDKEERDRRVSEALTLTHLNELSHRWPSQLSGGQKQRVGLARALAVNPSILLMDEPFNSADVLTRHSLQNVLIRIWKETHTSILFVTHDIAEALALGNRIVVLSDYPARIIAEYTLSTHHSDRLNNKLFDDMRHDIQQKLGMTNERR